MQAEDEETQSQHHDDPADTSSEVHSPYSKPSRKAFPNPPPNRK